MSSAIFQALKQGFNSKSILGVLAKQSPKLAKAIGAAEAAGYLHNSILKKLVGKESDDSDAYLTEHERTKKRDANRQKRLTRNVASTIGTVGALGAGLASYLDKEPQTSNQQPTQTPPGNPPAAPTQASQQQAPIPAQKQQLLNKFQNLPNAPTPMSPQGEAPQAAQPSQTETQFPQALLSVRKQLQNGKTPEEIDEHMRNSVFYRSLVEKYENETQTPFLQKIKEISESPQHAQEMTHKPQQMPKKPQEIPQPSQEPQMPEKVQNMPSIAVQPTTQAQTPSPLESESKPLSEGETVITPQGVGEVHKIHGDNAFTKIDGKLRKVPLNDIEAPSPEATSFVADFLEIPEEDRSGPTALWFYDPEDQNLWVQWHYKGQITKYKQFPPDLLEEIAAKNATPITTGKNEFGEWSPADKKSLGAAIDQFIKKDPRWKKAGKDQPANTNYITYEPGYDYWNKLRSYPKRKK